MFTLSMLYLNIALLFKTQIWLASWLLRIAVTHVDSSVFFHHGRQLDSSSSAVGDVLDYYITRSTTTQGGGGITFRMSSANMFRDGQYLEVIKVPRATAVNSWLSSAPRARARMNAPVKHLLRKPGDMEWFSSYLLFSKPSKNISFNKWMIERTIYVLNGRK